MFVGNIFAANPHETPPFSRGNLGVERAYCTCQVQSHSPPVKVAFSSSFFLSFFVFRVLLLVFIFQCNNDVKYCLVRMAFSSCFLSFFLSFYVFPVLLSVFIFQCNNVVKYCLVRLSWQAP
ncbi:unnamed protein product [Camellia sinensis]